MTKFAIGIDLGTSYSRAAVWQNNRVEIIPNIEGALTTPSSVAFVGTQCLIGEAATKQVDRNPSNTVTDAKRIIGRRFNDGNLQADMKHWPFKVISKDDNPVIQVEFGGETVTLVPEEISSIILTKMKKAAEEYLGGEVDSAVIAVPACFNDSQRQATMDAGAIAGLNVLNIINEPSAAAIAFDINKKIQNQANVLVFDVGGGHIDVSLLSIVDGTIKVNSSAGDTYYGGFQFDNILVDYCMNQFFHEFGVNISGDSRAVRRLRTACERAKIALSSKTQTTIEIDSLVRGHDFSKVLTRERYEVLIGKFYSLATRYIEKVLRDSGTDKGQVHEIVLVGGSTHIPRIRKEVSDFFGKEISEAIDPGKAVAYGAAVHAALLTNNSSDSVELLDVAFHSCSVGADDGAALIKRNTELPAKKTTNISTSTDNQTSIQFKVFEGESTRNEDNNVLGEFQLIDISPAPRGVPQLEVTFDVNATGILNVSALDKTTTKPTKITVTSDKGRLSKEDIEQMKNNCKKYFPAMTVSESRDNGDFSASDRIYPSFMS